MALGTGASSRRDCICPRSDCRGRVPRVPARHMGSRPCFMLAATTARGSYTPVEVAGQFSHTAQTLFRAYAKVLDDVHGVACNTMNEIISGVLRDAWGPMPGDP